MTREGISQVILHLMMHFPKNYPPDMPQQRVSVLSEDMLNSFKNFDDDVVIQAYKDLLAEQKTAPYIADAIAKARLLTADIKRNTEGNYQGQVKFEDGEKYFWNDTPGNNPVGWVRVAPMPRYMQERMLVMQRLGPGEKDPHDGAWYKLKYGNLPRLENMSADN